jgi:hypothetical protein
VTEDHINDKNCRGIYIMDVPSFVVSLNEDFCVACGVDRLSRSVGNKALRKNPRRAHGS